MEQIFSQLTDCFDLGLMISITILTYLVLKLLEKIVLATHKYVKQIITALCAIILCIIFYYFANLTVKQIIPTYLLSITFYDSIIKKVLEQFNVGYKKQ